MYKIELKVAPIRDGETIEAEIVVNRNVGGAGMRVSDAESDAIGKPDVRTFILNDDEYLTIRGKSSQELVYDKEQMAAVPRAAPV